MKFTMFTVLFLMVSFSAFAQEHPGDQLAQVMAANAADAVVSMAGQVKQLEVKVASAEKIATAAAARGDTRLEKKMNEKLNELKKELAELKDCTKYTGEAQTMCLELTSEGTNHRLIEAYEETLRGRPSSVQTNADNSTTVTYQAAQPDAIDNGGSETITIAEGPNGSFKQVKRVRYQPLPVQFPSVAGKSGDSDATSWVLWLGTGGAIGALTGAGVGGLVDQSELSIGNYENGGAGYGALIGAGTGMALTAVIKLCSD